MSLKNLLSPWRSGLPRRSSWQLLLRIAGWTSTLALVALACSSQRDPVSPSATATVASPAASGISANSPGASPKQGSGPNLRLRQPIACQLGRDCFVLLYPDRDPSGGEFDFQCGRLTYHDHDGTDFALPYRDEQTAVVVVAAADAKVVAVRDGVADRRIDSDEALRDIKARRIECGNGVLTERDDGWQLQYCHMKKGSIRVQAGQQISAGTPLGLVGESGMTTFPHVHLTVRYQGKLVDPFVGLNSPSGCAAEQGGTLQGRSPLWADPAVDYVCTGLVRAGFASSPVTEAGLWRGDYRGDRLPKSAPALLFWVKVFGVKKGDVETYRLVAPDGSVRVNSREPLAEDNKLWWKYVGQGTRNGPLMPGTWQASYQLERSGKTLIQLSRPVVVD